MKKLVAFLDSYPSEDEKESHDLIVEDESGTQWVKHLGSIPSQEAERVLDDAQNKILRGIDPR